MSEFTPIITSLLDNDLYKFSMGQAIFHQFPEYRTRWTFKCRNKDVVFTEDMVLDITRHIKCYCELSFTKHDIDVLRKIVWLKPSYLDFLQNWKPRFEDFTITREGDHGLSIETNGSWLNTSMYEVPVLAIVNEVYFKYLGYMKTEYNNGELVESFYDKLNEKVKTLISSDAKKDPFHYLCTFSEFGTRRRFSKSCQDEAIDKINDILYEYRLDHIHDGSKYNVFVGTSNVELANLHNITPVGTMAHEWIMCVGQGNPKHNPAYSNWYAMDAWIKEYGVLNGIALTDTIGTDSFLKDFNLTYATLFSGVRHDSGDPLVWADKIIAHYKKLGIDPSTKTLLFSDSLNFEKASNIVETLQKKYRADEGNPCPKIAFGIGTYISNDTIAEPLNIVMKVTECNGRPVAKISDDEGKGICKDKAYIDYLNRTIAWRLEH